MEKECVLYKREKDKLRCTACSHRCLIAKEKVGICGVRKNINGKLFLLVYGKPVSTHVDPIEKKPLYHFLPGTASFSLGTVGCSFRCMWCQNYDIAKFREFHTGIIGKDMSPEQIVKQAIKENCKSISYTYTEPTIFIEFAVDTAKLAKKKKLKNVLVTNGFMTKECFEYAAPYIDAMNIDLKSFNDSTYRKYCGGRLQPVLDTIKRVNKKGIHLEITTMIIPRVNDSPAELKKMAKFIASVDKNIPWHISRFFPTYKMMDKPITPIEILEKAEDIGKKEGLKYVYLGNV